MYSTCLFCHAALGANEAVEHFPVGRRLAFDAAKGRLWVVCRRCERWNLSPLEERWEAIEESERLFRGQRLRAQTDNVGLARLAEGLELVRIGAPLRPEFAAWRYGDQFGRRFRKHLLYSGLGVAAAAAVVAGAASFGAATFVGSAVFELLRTSVVGNPNTVVARMPSGGFQPAPIRRRDLKDAAFHVEPDGRWALWVQNNEGGRYFWGIEAERHAATLLAATNRSGTSAYGVRHAVRVLTEAEDPARDAVCSLAARAWQRTAFARGTPLAFRDFTPTERLALEMALQEEGERRALDGELAPLVAAWREAEEIAAIADALLLPAGVDARLARLRESETGRRSG